MSGKKGRVLTQEVVELIKNTLLEKLNDEKILTLGIEIDVKLTSGYRDKVWRGWKHPKPSNGPSPAVDSSSIG